MYTCVNNGCPDEGATDMKCKEGYNSSSPLCAVCDEGYFAQLRSCVKCKDPHIGALALFVLGMLLVVALVMYFFHRHSHLVTDEVVTNLKITVSFLTIVSTINNQFGVNWPPIFLSALAVLNALTFDLSVLSGVFCLYKVSFFASLCFSTASLVLILIVFFVLAKLKPYLKKTCIKLSVYLLLFAYPVVSVKCVEAFSCHNVDGQSYLRADYSINCNSSEWRMIAGYAAVFVIVYVVLLPVLVLGTLYRYRKLVEGRKVAPDNLLCSFLLDDYRLVMPCMMWDGFEIIRYSTTRHHNLWRKQSHLICLVSRKLALSVVGAFWSSQSEMAIATALLLSVGFLMVHTHYKPFKAEAANQVQQSCLSALSLMYFAGKFSRKHRRAVNTNVLIYICVCSGLLL